MKSGRRRILRIAQDGVWRFFAEPALSKILRFAQDDKKRRAQNDRLIVIEGF